MASAKEIISAYSRAYSVSPFGTGGALDKQARVVVSITDGTGTVAVSVGVANSNDGANPPTVNSTAFPTITSPTVSYTPAGGAGAGIPNGGPTADARNVALSNATTQLLTTLVATILATPGNTYP